MKIDRFKKVNEEVSEHDGLSNLIRNNTINRRNFSIIDSNDIKKLNRVGRKAYYVDDKGSLVEITPSSLYTIKHKKSGISELVNEIFLIEDSKKDKIEGFCKNIHEVYDLTMKKISTLGEVVRAYANKNDSE